MAYGAVKQYAEVRVRGLVAARKASLVLSGWCSHLFGFYSPISSQERVRGCHIFRNWHTCCPDDMPARDVTCLILPCNSASMGLSAYCYPMIAVLLKVKLDNAQYTFLSHLRVRAIARFYQHVNRDLVVGPGVICCSGKRKLHRDESAA